MPIFFLRNGDISAIYSSSCLLADEFKKYSCPKWAAWLSECKSHTCSLSVPQACISTVQSWISPFPKTHNERKGGRLYLKPHHSPIPELNSSQAAWTLKEKQLRTQFLSGVTWEWKSQQSKPGRKDQKHIWLWCETFIIHPTPQGRKINEFMRGFLGCTAEIILPKIHLWNTRKEHLYFRNLININIYQFYIYEGLGN